ncbi:hypothetical protein ScPMuIL_011248 [Solemya velum]
MSMLVGKLLLGYGSSSPALSNRNRFPTFFRTHPSATLHNPTRVKLFKKFKWKRIATIQETQEVFTSTVEDLEERVKDAGIEVAFRQNFLTDPANAVRHLKRQDARIIVGVFYEDMARRVFCQVYKEKLYGKKYVWFIIGWYPDNWYKKWDPNINCTADQLKEALEGHITTEAVILHPENTVTVSGMTSQQFKQRLDTVLNASDTSQVVGYPEAPLAYDAVWALALALNKTASRLAEKHYALEDFNYYNKEITHEIYSAMNATRFLGVSGNVAFSSQGDRIALTQIEQMINGTYHKLGYYDFNSGNLEWFNKEKWMDGKPPADHTRVMPFLRVVSQGLFFAMCGLAGLGIAAGVFCLIFNMMNVHRRCIAYSQPNINNITIIGCMLCLLCVFLLGLDGQFVTPDIYPLICQLRAWLLSIGFTFGYGGMFSKIWTVHRLTTMRKRERKVVKGWELYLVLGVILALDIGVLTSWQVLNPLYRDMEYFEQEDPTNTEDDIKLQPQLEHCNASNISIWLGVVFGYKGILLLFGIFLAYETRSVKLKQVNDSRFVGMSIYNVVVLCVITAPITLIISNQQDAAFAFVALAIILCSFLSMGLIFGPKIMEVIQNPKRNGLEIRTLTESMASKEEEERHQRLLSENEQLKKNIAEMEDKVVELNKKLQQKSQQRVELSTQESDPNGMAVKVPEVLPKEPPPSYTSCLTPNRTIPETREIRTPIDEIPICVDANSDSGLASGSIAKSSKTSASDHELETF